MSRESHLEIKVGAFVLVALVGLTFFIISVSDFSFSDKGRPQQLIFSFANGVKETAPVRLAGVEAGIVKALTIFTDTDMKTKVKVDITLRNDVQIPVDSKITINQLGFLGEKYIEILPGNSTEFYPEGSKIVGTNPVPVEKITEDVSHLTDDLKITIKGINEVLAQVKKGEGTIGKLFMDETIYKNLDELTLDLKANPWKLLYRPKQQK